MLGRATVQGNSVSLLCLYHTQQLLPALVALLQIRAQRGQGLHARTVAFVWCSPHSSTELLARRRAAFAALLAGFPWVELWMPEPGEVARSLSHRFRTAKKSAYFAKRFRGLRVGEIVYAHDLCDDFSPQAMMQAFPEAARICFGDALGVVYSRAYFDSMTLPLGTPAKWLSEPRKYLLHLLKRLHRGWLLPRSSRRLEAEYAALILGCDPGGDFLPGRNVVPIGFDIVAEVLAEQARGVEALPARRQVPPPANDRPEVVMLLGSYSESRLCSLEMEIELYRRSLARHVGPGARVLLKPHPVSARDKIERIVAVLSEERDVTAVDESLCEVPIEAMPWLCRDRRVVSYSYCSVSLVYLFGADVVHAMTEEMIESCFFPEVHEWVRDSNQLYLEQRVVAERLRSQRDLSTR